MVAERLFGLKAPLRGACGRAGVRANEPGRVDIAPGVNQSREDIPQ